MIKILKTYYSSAKDTPLSVFMKILDGSKATELIKPGGLINPRPEKLLKAWNTIYFDFLDAVKSYEYLHRFHTIKQIAKLNTTKAILVNLKFNARSVKDPNFIKLLNKAGIFPGKATLTVIKIEKIINSRLKTIDLDLRKLESAVQKDANKVEKQNNNFVESLVHLSKQQGYRLDPEKITVMEFAIMVKDAEKLKENGKNNGNNRRSGI